MKTIILQEKSAADFLEKNELELLKHESEHNLILGLSDAIRRSKRASKEPLFFTVEKEGEIVGQAIRTEPDKPLALSHMSEEAAKALAAHLKSMNLILEGVVGPLASANTFVKEWQGSAQVGMHQGVYELHTVIPPDYQGGELRLATDEDEDIVKVYSEGFIKDCFPDDPSQVKDAFEAGRRNIQNGTLYLWVNREGNIVSMAARNRESPNGATISWVYTPPEERTKGYGSCVVAALSSKILREGKKFCNLYTDLINPTSNSIYQKVGYKKIAESIHYDLRER